MKLFVAYSQPGTNAWSELPTLALAGGAQGETGVVMLSDTRVDLPNGEALLLAAAYWPRNQALTLSAAQGGRTLIMVSTHKHESEDHSPQVVFLTPGGLQVSLMLGPSRPE